MKPVFGAMAVAIVVIVGALAFWASSAGDRSAVVVGAEVPAPTTSTTPDPTSTQAPTPTQAPASVAPASTIARDPVEPARPLRVSIPGIDVDAEIIDLGLNDDGTLEVPTDFGQTGWYTGRSVPGDEGPAVVVGHVDSYDGPAVFYELKGLSPGDEVDVERSDGQVATFRVTDSVLVDKDEFPTEDVYGPTAEPVLRLITCGGGFDRSARSYEGNLIVYAELVELREMT